LSLNNQPRVILAMLLLNSFAVPLMLSSANVALPTIASELSLTAIALSWVPMAFLMASTMFVLIFGRLADNVGRKRIFLIGTVAVIITSVIASLSQSDVMLLTARFLQGASAAMLHATQMAIISSVFPASQRGKYIGLVTGSIYVGLSAGPLLGGLVIDSVGWRASFLMHVPLATIVLVMGVFFVRDEWRGEKNIPFDLLGAVGWIISILLFCLGVSRLPSPDSYLLLFASVISITLFVRHARTTAHPLWDVKLFFGNRTFTLSAAASLMMYSATYANVVLLSLYLQSVKGLSASSAGMIMMIQPAVMALGSPIMGRLSDRLEPRWLASAGMAVTAGGLFVLASLHPGSSLMHVAVALLMTGGGFALFSSPNVNAIMGSVEPKHFGSASGAVATTRLIGQLNSMVLVTLVVGLVMGNTLISEDSIPQLARAIDLSFAIAGLICLPGIAFSLARGRMHSKPS
jgi:EmrB/QacA subfamily drug resistance transporter